ncbi:MAG: MarR family transcriptional regulator [Sneathiellaceae bacterium]
MSEVKVTVGGDFEDQASRRFIDAWHRAERGATAPERHLAFESWEALAKVLTGRRVALLRHVRHNEVASIRALAAALGRDYSNVHRDVRSLEAAGLLEVTEAGLRADYDAIDAKVAI